MRYIRNWIISIAIMVSAGGALFALATPQTVSAAAPICGQTFFTFPAWYRGLVDDNVNCKMKEMGSDPGQIPLSLYIWTIVLNVLEMGLVLAGYIAAAFILYGGVQYILSQGVVEGAAKARSTILNAIIGLVISMISVGIVKFIVDKVVNNNATTKIIWDGTLSVVYMVSGAFAVYIIIIAGFMYTTANGDPAKIAKAKNAIMYSVIGLIVVLIAFIVTQFVIGRMGSV